MPEQIPDKKVFSLLEVSKSIQHTLAMRYTSSFWVKAEMNKLNHYQYSGHCYPDLVEKKDGMITAQLKATLWKEDYQRADQKFRMILKEPLKDGIKILFLARISFDPVHGLALRILEIDPAFTLGDLEQEKQETIDRLKIGNIFNQNKLLHLPLLPQRIAIISVESSKGYADFVQVINNNPWKYRLFHFLFPSILQGDKAAADIIAQLNRIRKVIKHFDVVAIIRGGGGDVGLSCYNNYALAESICKFPLPVITGIGHSTNETVSELISFHNAITPTKLAEYLIQHFHNVSVPLLEAEKKITDWSRNIISERKSALLASLKLFRSVTENVLIRNKNLTRELSTLLHHQIKFRFRQEREYQSELKYKLERGSGYLTSYGLQSLINMNDLIQRDCNSVIKQKNILLQVFRQQLRQHVQKQIRQTDLTLNAMEKNISNMSPSNVLRRGYSITRVNGVAISNSTQATAGDKLHTTFYSGNIISIAESIEKQDTDE